MSLISDPDFILHSLRLSYLRNVDDPYGPRIISLDPAHRSNPYIMASGLASEDRWPELALPASPPPSDDDTAPRPRFGASGLKYTTTIMGPSRSGGAGLRVSGKRASVVPSKRVSRVSAVPTTASDAGIAIEVEDEDGRVRGHEATPSTNGNVNVNGNTNGNGVPASVSSAKSATSAVRVSEDPPADVTQAETSTGKISPEFVPKFKGAAEMEARRRLRMLARAGPAGIAEPSPGVPWGARVPLPTTSLNPELSSSDEDGEDEASEDDEEGLPEDDEEFDMVADADDSMEMDGDEFDPEFAASRATGASDSASEGASMLSGSGMSTSNSSNMASSLLPSSSARIRSKLSPVREGRHSEEKPTEVILDRPDESHPMESGFEMVTPALPARTAASQNGTPGAVSSLHPSSASSDDMFARRPVPAVRSVQSSLSAMLASSSNVSSSNPFTELYSAISGRSEGESTSVSVYFPHARNPAGRVMELNVRKDATVEEVLGFSLWTYWEEGWEPKLDEGLEGEEDPQWAVRCSAVGWILRIAEEDGEVDEDFPPPDRTGKISKFKFDAYAVLEATPAQVQQNKLLESKIQRRLSRIVIKKKKSAGLLTNPSLAPPADALLGTSAVLGGSLGSSVGMFPSSLGPSSSHGPPQFLRVRIADTADAVHVSTTIQASGGMYMAEVLDAVCLKRKISNPKDFALILDLNPGMVYIPLDRTVKSLQGKRNLMLVKQDMLPHYGVEVNTRTGRTTDPNASILKRSSEVPEQTFSSMFDYTNAYRRYTVYRKAPMLVTRSARMLAIDGGYIHIIPSVNKAKHVFDSGKTSSYHLKSVVACQQSSKNSSTFKLVVHSDAERNKRYEFEAENPKMANEIVQTIRGLKAAMERPGTIKQSRRSRHVS